jgi:acyl carrier protein
LEEWSSLLALSVIAMVDDIYQVEIGAKEIVKCDTIEELYELAKSLKQSE